MYTKEKTIYNALPKLPTFNFPELNEPVSFGRKQYCIMADDGMRTVLSEPAGKFKKLAQGTDRAEGCGIPVRVILDRFPQWKTLDDKVLRFFAYYVERVNESMIEESRVRKVKVHYHLADGTISIVETPAVDNSGLRRGTTVGRFKEDGVDVFKLCIGGTVMCRALEYNLVDCDAATREFFEVMGMPQPEPMDYPLDTFEERSLRPPPTMDENHVAMRRAVEVQAAAIAGTHASLLTPEERAKARDYYEHDREVLRFYAVWDKREFRVQYYIADGTVAVMFDPTDNDGRVNNAVFLRREKVPKDTKKGLLLQTETLNRPQGAMPAFLAAEDLLPGNTVDIYARPFFVYDCDTYTRDYLASKGFSVQPHPRPFSERDMELVARRRPRGGKSGASADGKHAAEVDANGNKLGASSMIFDDTVTTKDARQMARYAQDVFRFAGRLLKPATSDEGRRFIISYYLADDTVSVYEMLIRNSGHRGGKIFSRRTVEEIDHPRKLQVGDTVVLDATYVLEEMDERTKRYIAEGLPEVEERHFRAKDLIAKAQNNVSQRFSRTTDAFRHYASSSLQGLTKTNVLEVLTDSGIRPTDEELECIMEHVDRNHDGWVSLEDFTEHFLGQQFMSDFQPRTVARDVAGPSIVVPRGPIRSAAMIASRANAQKSADEALYNFLIKMEARRTLMLRSFRTCAAESYDGNIGVEDFQRCLEQRLHLSLPDEEFGALIYKFYYTPGVTKWLERRLPLQELHRLIML